MIRALAACLSLALLALAGGCRPDGADQSPSEASRTAAVPADAYFTEITAEIGIPDPPAPWPDATYALYENAGIGLGFLDYDGDGDLDLYHTRFPGSGKRVW